MNTVGTNIRGMLDITHSDCNGNILEEQHVNNAIYSDYGDQIVNYLHHTFNLNNGGSSTDYQQYQPWSEMSPAIMTSAVSNDEGAAQGAGITKAKVNGYMATGMNSANAENTDLTQPALGYGRYIMLVLETTASSPVANGPHKVLCTSDPNGVVVGNSIKFTGAVSSIHTSSVVYNKAYLWKAKGFSTDNNYNNTGQNSHPYSQNIKPLIANAEFSSDITVAATDTLSVTWTITLSGS